MHWPHLILPLLCCALPVQAQTLDLLLAPNPGVFEAGAGDEVVGAGAQVLNRLAQLSGLELRLRLTPVARALQLVQGRPGSCIAGTPRLPEYEAQFRWVGPLAGGTLTLYGRTDEARVVNGLDDLRGTSIVAQRESYALQWLHDHGLPAYEVNDTQTGLRMLRAGRADYWLTNDVVARPAMQRASGAPLRSMRDFGRVELWLACHRDISADAGARLAQGLAQLRRNGELAAFGLR